MAKDDYDVIVFKVLTYLYACLKRKIQFSQAGFDKAIHREALNDDYLTDILWMMQEEGQIAGIEIIPAWGDVRVISSELSEMHITAAGIHYLKENGAMQKVYKALTAAADSAAALATLIGL